MADLVEHLQAALGAEYAIEREVGRGGMAIVFRARERKHGRTVAVKVLRTELAGVIGQERFLREIHYSAEFSHPCILPLLDSGTVPAGDGFPGLPYYTMPFVEGESLRERLRRDRQLPVETAIGVAQDVAAALDHAHAKGVIHRDIKPENIYLTGGHAIVADFGIARAVQQAADPDVLTSAGLVVGTALYMSPEQAAADPALDGRSDVYALGCVTYEMLGGEPPFVGATAQAILARHRLDPPPALATLRPGLPSGIEQAVMRALAKSPADRFRGAAEFGTALTAGATGEVSPSPSASRWLNRRSLLLLLLAAIGAAAAGFWARGGAGGRQIGATATQLDTTRYAIVSFSEGAGVPAQLQPTILLQDALGRWNGIHVVDQFQVREAIGRRDTSGFSLEDWSRLSSQLGAGRYVRADAALVGDSIRLHAVLYHATPGKRDPVLREYSVRIPADLAGRDAAFAELGERLLVNTGPTGGWQPAGRTTSLPARQAFEAGTTALNEWDLALADSSFAAAARFDPTYAEADLWLALVRSWEDPEETATWRSSAERAVAGRAELPGRDRRIADAILAQARGELLVACNQWQALTGENPHDFVVWYGLATCLHQDRVVVRDRRSPTGWRFRSSYQAALDAYAQAYRLLPPILKRFRSGSYSGMIELLFAGNNSFRRGQGVPPDPATFYAFPSWEGDSLVLHPVPLGENGLMPGPSTGTIAEAIHHQRLRLYDIARGWVAEYPASADALQALGVSLQLLGDRSAIDTLVKARRLARTPGEVIRTGTSEVWARVLFLAPDSVELTSARRLADSLLSVGDRHGAVEPMMLASLAVLTGRAHLAARLGSSINSSDRLDTPPALVGIAMSFLTYAALGGPRDSLALLAQRVTRALETGVAKEALPWAQEMWLQLPVLIGFPAYPFPEAARLAAPGGGLMAGYAAYLRRDTAGVLAAIQPRRNTAEPAAPPERTIDIGYGTAWLLAELGEGDAAARSLDQILSALPRASPQRFLEVYQAGPLVRAMALRADLAARLGDRATATAWAVAVEALWSEADPFLQPVVQRMEALAR